MKSHEEIKVIFDDIKKRIKKLGDKIKWVKMKKFMTIKQLKIFQGQ
jgi:hypothetical protein